MYIFCFTTCNSSYRSPAEAFEPYLLEQLEDPVLAAELLNTAIDEYLEDGDTKAFIGVLCVLAMAGNVSQIARDAGISRNQLYMIIEGKSDPTLSSLLRLFRFELKPIRDHG